MTLKQKIIACLLSATVFISGATFAEAAKEKVRLTWPVVPGAVQYQVVILKNRYDAPVNILITCNKVYTNGVEVDISPYAEQKYDLYWKVCPLNFEGKPVGEGFSAIKPVAADGKFNTDSPLPTTEFDQMAEMALYPVYSWIPVLDATRHQVEVYKKDEKDEKKDRLVRRVEVTGFNYAESAPYTEAGEYYWRVRGLDSGARALGNWSAKVPFTVKSPVKVAALGDSITQGGGVVSVPAGYVIYDWETYSPVPIKNMGYSGDTLAMMLERFDRDVLPFKPQILVVMGGVNDFRGVTTVWSATRNLKLIKEKCEANNIVPVFVTAPPISIRKIMLRGMMDPPPGDWRARQLKINEWVKEQKHWVDICPALTDARGELNEALTTDGLHPDQAAKAYIGDTVGNYVLKTFPYLFRDKNSEGHRK